MRMKPASKGLAFFLALSLIFSSFVPLSVFAAVEPEATVCEVGIDESVFSNLKVEDTAPTNIDVSKLTFKNASGEAIATSSTTGITTTVSWAAANLSGSAFKTTGDAVATVTVTIPTKNGIEFGDDTSVSAVLGDVTTAAVPEKHTTASATFVFSNITITNSAVSGGDEPSDPGETTPDNFKLSLNLTGVKCNGHENGENLTSGASFSATLEPADSTYGNVTVTAATMGNTSAGITVTTSGATVIVSIGKVTSNVAITATADPITGVTTNSALDDLFTDGEGNAVQPILDAIAAAVPGIATNVAIASDAAVASVNAITTLNIDFSADGVTAPALQSLSILPELKTVNITQTAITDGAAKFVGVYAPNVGEKNKIVPEGIATIFGDKIGVVMAPDKTTPESINYTIAANTPAGGGSAGGASLFAEVQNSIKVKAFADYAGAKASLPESSVQLKGDATLTLTKGETTTKEIALTINPASASAITDTALWKISNDEATSAPGSSLTGYTVTTVSATSGSSVASVTIQVASNAAVTSGSIYLWCGTDLVGIITVSTAGGSDNPPVVNPPQGGGGGGSSSSKYTVSFNSMGGSSVASQSVAKNGTVTKPADPTKDGFIFDGWYLDKEYKEKYDFSTAVTKSFTLYAKWTENDAFAQFTDVSGHWAVNAIEFVVDKGLFFGTSKNSFSPDVAMTRGMFVTVLGRLNGVSPSGNAAFSDVSSSMYYSPYIAWATSNNIVSGVGNNKFEPDREISRQEMATMMYNYAKFIGKEGYEEIVLADVYADAENIAVWAEVGMEYTASNKLMVGKPGDLADPLATATRAEVAQLIMQFSNFLADAAAK